MGSFKTLLLIAFALASSLEASTQSLSLRVSQTSLGEPFYRSLSRLSFLSSNFETGNVSVKFLGKLGEVIEVQEGLKVRRNDYTSCSSGFCSATFYELPLSLEKHTCFIEVKFSTPSGQVHLESRANWGDCVSTGPVPDLKYRPDFIFPSDSYFSESGTIDLQNIGSSHLLKNLGAWAILTDRDGGIIWRGSIHEEVSVASQQKLTMNFQTPMKDWHRHLACGGFILIDPEFEVFERSKLNNTFRFDFGLCEEIPSVASGDRIDFVPVFNIVNGILHLKVVNNGRLPFTDQTTRLETSIRYLDSDREIIFKKNPFTSPDIFGFGDEKEIIADAIPAGTCFIEAELNPNITIKESNYINNRIELNVCEK